MRFSNSSISTFRTCPKKYYWVFVESLLSKEVKEPLEIGHLVHRALAHYRLNKPDAKEIAEQHPEALRLYQAYLQAYPEEPFTSIAVEHLTEAEILPNHLYLVKGDELIRFRGLLMMHDYKTMAADNNRWITSHVNGPQVKGYIWGMQHSLKERIHGCLWDFIFKTKVVAFRRIPQLYSPAQIENWLVSTRDCIKEILRCCDNNYFPQDLSECYTFLGECAYTPLCASDTPEVRQSLYTVKDPYSYLQEF